ncbi:hypothetical protein R6Q57_010338 [Mikania cordata]
MINNDAGTGAADSTKTTAAPSSSSNTAAQSLGLKSFFKTPEGRYKLYHDKSHPSSLLPYALAKSITQITLAHVKDQPVQAAANSPVLQPSSSYSVASSGVRYVTSKILGSSGNGSRMLGFIGGNGSKANGGASKSAHVGGLSNGASSAVSSNTSDGKGSYLIFNVGDNLYIIALNSEEKDPIKSISFGNSNPICHAFDSEAKDGHDFLIGLNTGDVYLGSLRLQLQDVGKKLVGAHHYNKDGTLNNSKDGCGDSSFPVIRDQAQFSVAHARSSKSNPFARWHICQGPINAIAFSADGRYLATVGRDVENKCKMFLFSFDGKYILTGGEDDLVQVWSMEDRKVVAWGEGHNSWVSGVAFDPYWSTPTSEDESDNTVYRFGSVGQDTQLLLWDLAMDELVVPLRRPLGGSPTYSRTQSSHWDNVVPVGTLQPAPSTKDIPKLAPLVAHRAHYEPLSGLVFSRESIVTASRDGHLKIWMRPGNADPAISSSDTFTKPASSSFR